MLFCRAPYALPSTLAGPTLARAATSICYPPLDMGELQWDYEDLHNQQSLEVYGLEWYCDNGYTPQYQSRVQDYNGFNGYAPRTADPIHETGMHSPFPIHPTLGTTFLQLQPWTMPQVPQWPSTLTSQSTYQASLFFSSLPPTTPTSVAPASVAPASVIPADSCTSLGPQKPLTDADRERMCRYHEKNPTDNQTFIASMFGVERSTVSKILSRRDKYMYRGNDRPTSKLRDIERTLSNWAKKHQEQGLLLSDAVIKEKARFFAQAVGSQKSLRKINGTKWLEKFKEKNHIMGTEAEQSEGASYSPSNVHSPEAISSTSSSRLSPASTTEIASALPTIGESMLPSSTQAPNSMQPPALPSISDTGGREPFADSWVTTPSREEAACALELVMSFFQSHRANFFVESQECVAIRRLIEKLRIKPSSQAHASDTRCVTEPDVAKTTLEAFDVDY
ncbi:CenpB-DNA-bind-like protein [Alternaria alternata]|nr:CenpB-DNA-bind-like protein [Alternaria alternata]